MALKFLHTCICASWMWSYAAEVCEQSQSTLERSAPAPSLIQQTKQLQDLREDFSAKPISDSRVEAPVRGAAGLGLLELSSSKASISNGLSLVGASARAFSAGPSKLVLTGAFCGFVGGALGGLAAVIADIVRGKDDDSMRLISLVVGGLAGAAVAGIAHVGVFPMVMSDLSQADEGTGRLFDESLFDKLEHLAHAAASITRHEEQVSATPEEREGYAADKKEALKILNDLYRIELDPKTDKTSDKANKAVVKDFHDLEEVLSHGHTSEFESAQTAKQNMAILTEQDIAMIEGERGEDTGADNATDNGHVLGTAKADMLFPEKKEKESLVQHSGQSSRIAAGTPWKDAVVNYCIAPDVSVYVQHLIEGAISTFTRGIPCLKFVDVGHKKGTSQDPLESQLCQKSPAIFFQSNPFEGCYAYVGMIDFFKAQTVQIQEPKCASLGIIKHEIGHALGMAHEQSRSDRDEYVKIYWTNIKDGKEGNFEILDKAYTVENYDLLSIMHYDSYAFAKDSSQVTIEEIGATTHDVMGQRNGLSQSDIFQLAKMYQQEVDTCEAAVVDGFGCIDNPDTNGNDVCTGLSRCNSQAVGLCCACGGGTAVQCYKGSECPKVPALPPPEGSDCLEDITYHFAGQGYQCIYRNRCNFDVKWKCPSYECEHTAKSLKATMTYCGSNVQTEICEPNRCQVWKA